MAALEVESMYRNGNHIKEIIDIKDVQTRNNTLRKCFCAYTELVEISGYEKEDLIILTSLTYKKQQVEDLLDEKLAKNTLKNVLMKLIGFIPII